MNSLTTVHLPPALTAPTLNRFPFRGVAAQLRRAAGIAGDLFMVGGVVFCIPFVILAIGIPVALFVQLLLLIAQLF